MNTHFHINDQGFFVPTAEIKGETLPGNEDIDITQAGGIQATLHPIFHRIKESFPHSMNFGTLAEFEERTRWLKRRLGEEDEYRKLANGVCLPLVLGQYTSTNLGSNLEKTFIASAARSYCLDFPGRELVNYRKGKLADMVEIVEGTRHDRVIAKMAESPVYALYFPYALLGWSIPADRELIAMLPENFALTGGIDTATALAGYSYLLASNYRKPTLDCAAICWDNPNRSLFFRPDDDELVFDRGRLSADENYAGGLLYLG